MRRLALALVLIAAALAAAWWSAGTRRGGARADPESAAESSSHASAELVAPHAPADRESAASPEPSPRAARSDEQPATPATSEPRVVFSGTVVALDRDEPHPEEDGRFALSLWNGRVARTQPVEVRGGAWTVEVDGDPFDALSIGGFVLDRRAATCEIGPRERLPASTRRLDLVARWTDDVLVHVRCGTEVDDVELVETEASMRWTPQHPGHVSGSRGVRGSPFTIQAPSPQRAYFVRAAGCAWRRLEPPEGEREIVVELEPAGDLVVVLEGEAPPEARLAFYRTGLELPIAEVSLELVRAGLRFGRPVLDGLPVGELEVRAQVGEPERALVLARTSVEIVAGRSTTAKLSLASVERPALVPLGGTLHVPREWQLERVTLSLQLQDPPLAGVSEVTLRAGLSTHRTDLLRCIDPERGAWTWSAEDVQPGRWLARLIETGYSAPIDLDAAGARAVHLEVPPPCELLVRCVDDGSGAPVAVRGLEWALLHGDASISSRIAPRRDMRTQTWSLRVPAGRVLVRALGDLEGAELVHDARPGTERVELRVRRATGLRVILRDGRAVVPWERERLATLLPAEGQAEAGAWRAPHALGTLLAREPGQYTLVVPELPGYLPVADQLVRLEKGVVGEHVIELRRAR